MKNIVICCDGTGNEVEANLSNVLKLYRVLEQDASQVVFYDPGVGTLSRTAPWSRLTANARLVFGLATGNGLDENILNAYSFLVDTYEDGDKVFLFGFSRGAYTVRALAGFLHLVGLVAPSQKNLCGYALVAYKKAAADKDLTVAWRFQRVVRSRSIPIEFLGVWDTVSSVLVPRRDRFYIPSLQRLPYTATNPSVKAMRHAIAIDERRRMFRLNQWNDSQPYQPRRSDEPVEQDVRQVWFAGVHADVGGGYPETESQISKYPLQWMLDEAAKYGLDFSETMEGRVVRGEPATNGRSYYVAPDALGPVHDSMTGLWPVLEYVPKLESHREWPHGAGESGFYLPRSEPRRIPEGALIHESAIRRVEASGYQPVNLPVEYTVEPPVADEGDSE